VTAAAPTNSPAATSTTGNVDLPGMAAEAPPPQKAAALKFEPLPLVHSGLSGDLDLLFLPDDGGDRAPDG
jgi:hypothetical protein